jgi:outer membrane lipoprotein SlyB
MDEDMQTPVASDGETHATTGGAAAAGAVVAGAIGLAGGPLGAAIGAVGGAIVGAAAERMMHSEDDHLPANVYEAETTDVQVPHTDVHSEPSASPVREE